MDDNLFMSCLGDIARQTESELPFSELHEAWKALSPEEKEAVKKRDLRNYGKIREGEL